MADSAIRDFKVTEISENNNFALDILRSLKRKRSVQKSYSHIDWIPSTSNICERLFSLAKLALGTLRRGQLMNEMNQYEYI